MLSQSALDIVPFALPNCGPAEVRFEEPRDITRVVVGFKAKAPARIGLSYLQKTWPQVRVGNWNELASPGAFGWTPMDDWFNCRWQKAAASVTRETRARTAVTFRGTSAEFPDLPHCDVTYRRTLGIRIDVADPSAVESVSVFTRSMPAHTRLRVELDAGRKTATKTIRFDGYNAIVRRIIPAVGTSLRGDALHLTSARRRSFELDLRHMRPAHRYSGDDGHVRFILDRDSFTVSLPSLERQGPIWFAEKGFYVALADDPTPFAEYRAACRKRKTIAETVAELPEQTYEAAVLGQPRPHDVSSGLGCKHARQRFWIEPDGDVVLPKWNVASIRGKDTDRYAAEGTGRFFFGLGQWQVLAHYPDPAPAPANNLRRRRNAIEVEQQAFAVPLERSILQGEPAGDESIVCLVRFRFRNVGDTAAVAELPISYSHDSGRAPNPYYLGARRHDEWAVPRSEKEPLHVKGNRVYGTWNGRPALRCAIESSMNLRPEGERVVLSNRVEPGQTCEAVVRIPFIALDTPRELQALDGLDFDRCHVEMTQFWRDEAAQGAQLRTPVPQLNELHKAHLAHVQITDVAMPDEPRLVNTSVGASTYGNFSNESCMINQELDQRGMIEDVRRRLEVWVRYQGTVPQPGNFTDHNGMYYGAGGFECGHYNQHHGWVLWRLSEHFLYTGDRHWFAGIADSLIAGADWVFRQRRNTMGELPHSRGWEHGFLPAGSLEDVTDFFYWLSTNALTWRGTDTAARALEEYAHPEAKRVRREADAYGRDLRRGFETMRQHSPLVRLRNGRWVPHYPSRVYCRGRDLGWIREVLEGSVYLLISGLYKANAPQAKWILDDYHDNRYLSPPFGYVLTEPEKEWYARGGFSIQPNLLAGLMPYLERDEPEIFIWMFFNAWAACYRHETNAMTEHPLPVLGYSNLAQVKTSDQSNAVMWLRYMLVFATGDTLHFGRALPRAWLRPGQPVAAERVRTIFGSVGASYEVASSDCTRATVSLELRREPGSILVRFPHPEKKHIKSVTVNGKPHRRFDARSDDVDISRMKGTVKLEVCYA